MEKETRYYAVETKCGHVRRSNFIRITYAVKATSKSEAASIARFIPRVKHDKKDAIFSVREISYEEYIDICQTNNKDPYLNVHSKQDQNLYCVGLEDRIEKEDRNEVKYNRKERITYKKKKYQSFMKSERYLDRIYY